TCSMSLAAWWHMAAPDGLERLQPRFDSAGVANGWVLIIVLVIPEPFTQRTCVFIDRLRATLADTALDGPADRDQQRIECKSNQPVEGQVRHGPPGIGAYLEQQVQRSDGNRGCEQLPGGIDDGRAQQQHRDDQPQGLAQGTPQR